MRTSIGCPMRSLETFDDDLSPAAAGAAEMAAAEVAGRCTMRTSIGCPRGSLETFDDDLSPWELLDESEISPKLTA